MTLSRWALLAPLAVALCACHATTTRPPDKPSTAHTSAMDHPGGSPHTGVSKSAGKGATAAGPVQAVSATTKPQRFILVDGVAMQAAMTVARRLNPHHQSLYSNLPENTFGVLAPHLFRYEPGSSSEQLWLSIGRGRSWGLQLVASASLTEVVSHLQRFLLIQVNDAQGNPASPLYLRFYDPRVMHTLLRTLDSEQRVAFFGPIERFIVEHDQRKDTDVHYTLRADGALAAEQVAVASVIAPPVESLVGAVEAAREQAFLRADIKRYGQLTALRNASDSATPFCSVCSCNEFEVTRPSGLTFSQAQNKQFSAHALRWYKHRVFVSLRAKETRHSDAELKSLTEFGYKRAVRYGITNQGPTYEFIELMVDLGRHFDTRYPWAKPILTDPSLDQAAKVERLKRRRDEGRTKGQVVTPR